MQVITKLLYLQHQGETFTAVRRSSLSLLTRHRLHAGGANRSAAAAVQKEATEVFFAVTKLYQNSDMNLRRMVYLCLKDICPDAAEVMIVTNSLMKDMNAPQELYRANAIRVLRTIIDPSLLQSLERYFKQCIVDKAPVRRRPPTTVTTRAILFTRLTAAVQAMLMRQRRGGHAVQRGAGGGVERARGGAAPTQRQRRGGEAVGERDSGGGAEREPHGAVPRHCAADRHQVLRPPRHLQDPVHPHRVRRAQPHGAMPRRAPPPHRLQLYTPLLCAIAHPAGHVTTHVRPRSASPSQRRVRRARGVQIKYIARVLKDTGPPPDGERRPFYDYLHASLRHKSDMVMFQAARTIAELNQVTSAELAPAITCLQLFLASGKSILRFAAVRILNGVSMKQPAALAACNSELEALLTDTNRSIAVYAITTLLKTGSEASVDRVLKQIRAFMADIPDDFKVVVVDAIHALCLKYPAKYRTLLNFLSHMLREEGGYEFKRAIVEATLVLMRAIPDAREPGLLHLAEFIEDCEFTQLATQARRLSVGARFSATRAQCVWRARGQDAAAR